MFRVDAVQSEPSVLKLGAVANLTTSVPVVVQEQLQIILRFKRDNSVTKSLCGVSETPIRFHKDKD